MSHPHPELSAPNPLPKGGLRVIPLGGLGEIGRNMTAFEYDGRLLLVDCGVLFPEDHHPGVDLILPDFEPIRDRLDTIEALDDHTFQPESPSSKPGLLSRFTPPSTTPIRSAVM